ncbi:hypothetical protein I0C86_03165 [Plantactinospora sp. S1510]|uniref:Uncharacterized protein n=1 Tax=Plantactinospora alkalitolerans TaxID=2789879 RepID=A0ABS0GP83_9ACTN|nr:hypothetical protein [Plantactinospora alkalitolerans]MBF9127998.1 hypothetical protein [Plantactinospora alkalitolerans]
MRLWNPTNSKPIGSPLTGHTDDVNAVVFSPDAQRLATTSNDKTVRLWSPELHVDPVRSLCEQAGEISHQEWASYAAGELFVGICS